MSAYLLAVAALRRLRKEGWREGGGGGGEVAGMWVGGEEGGGGGTHLGDDGDDEACSHADGLHKQAWPNVRESGYNVRGCYVAPEIIFRVALSCSNDVQMRTARPAKKDHGFAVATAGWSAVHLCNCCRGTPR